jgi:tRNA (guanine37-N1)-methyltransferase
MRIDILTLFPEAVNAMMSSSILGRGAAKGAIEINCVQIRDFTTNKQQQVDDYPYGGGWGCVMMAQPLKACLDHVTAQAGPRRRRVIYMSPQGKRFDQTEARRLVTDYDHLVLVCGHYEGVDERFITLCCDEEMSIGDFVLTGGEIPAMAIADSVCRMVPGVLSDPQCYMGESHWDGLLEYPQYTRPDVWEGMQVPEILRSGNHKDVEHWRREQQLLRTMEKRPDMFAAFQPQTKEDEELVRRVTGREKLTYDCRRASPEDVDTLLAITAQASAFLAQQGVSQWQDGFPNRDVFLQDIQAGNCWLFTHDGQPAGCVSLYRQPEPDYDAIQGQWLTQGDYGTVHRLAVAEGYRGRGLATEMLTFMEDLLQGLGYPSVRVDTHRDNQPMRKLLKKQGYTRCGVVYLTDTVEEDNRRVAYEKVFG